MNMTLNDIEFSTKTCWNEKYHTLNIHMSKDRDQGQYRSGLKSRFVPNSSPIKNKSTSVSSNVTEQDLINLVLRKLAEQQKNQRDLQIKTRISKQTHDIKLAKTLSPTTKNLNESTNKNQ